MTNPSSDKWLRSFEEDKMESWEKSSRVYCQLFNQEEREQAFLHKKDVSLQRQLANTENALACIDDVSKTAATLKQVCHRFSVL